MAVVNLGGSVADITRQLAEFYPNIDLVGIGENGFVKSCSIPLQIGIKLKFYVKHIADALTPLLRLEISFKKTAFYDNNLHSAPKICVTQPTTV